MSRTDDEVGHLEPGWREEDVHAARVVVHRRLEVGLAKVAGRQVADRWDLRTDPELPTQVAVLEAAVDESGLAGPPGRGPRRGCRRSSSCRRRPWRHGPRRSGSWRVGLRAAPAVAASRMARTRSYVPKGIVTTPSTRARVASSIGRSATARATIGTVELAFRRRSMTVAPETRPWRRRSTTTTSGRSSRTWVATERPVADDVDHPDHRLGSQQLADVAGHVRARPRRG